MTAPHIRLPILGESSPANARAPKQSLTNKQSIEAIPFGWYSIGFSGDIQPGRAYARTVAGQEIAVYRVGGQLHVVDGFCPHNGAHLGHGGTVEGDLLVCPFHHFKFDTSGTCVSGNPGQNPPKKCLVGRWHSAEVNNHVLVYYHPERRAPEWTIPVISSDGWLPGHEHTARVFGHPQEMSENSVDVFHFATLHRFDNVGIIQAPEPDGPLLRAHYTMSPGAIRPLFGKMRVSFRVEVWGLGYSIVFCEATDPSIRFRYYVLATPTDPGFVDLRLETRCAEFASGKQFHPFARVVPAMLLNRILPWALHTEYVKSVEQDYEIWKNKTFIERPVLADGDGGFSVYRRWAKSFYV